MLNPAERSELRFVIDGLPARGELRILQNVEHGEHSYALVWSGGEMLARWLCRQPWVSSLTSALELGAGTGIVSIALAMCGVPDVLATDWSEASNALCLANAQRNGVALSTCRYAWGSPIHPLLQALPDGLVRGACPSLLVLSDCLYEWDSAVADRLEQTLRALLSVEAGGCRFILCSWEVRNGSEERFLTRLADVGRLEDTEWLADPKGTSRRFGVRLLRVKARKAAGAPGSGECSHKCITADAAAAWAAASTFAASTFAASSSAESTSAAAQPCAQSALRRRASSATRKSRSMLLLRTVLPLPPGLRRPRRSPGGAGPSPFPLIEACNEAGGGTGGDTGGGSGGDPNGSCPTVALEPLPCGDGPAGPAAAATAAAAVAAAAVWVPPLWQHLPLAENARPLIENSVVVLPGLLSAAECARFVAAAEQWARRDGRWRAARRAARAFVPRIGRAGGSDTHDTRGSGAGPEACKAHTGVTHDTTGVTPKLLRIPLASLGPRLQRLCVDTLLRERTLPFVQRALPEAARRCFEHAPRGVPLSALEVEFYGIEPCINRYTAGGLFEPHEDGHDLTL